MDRAAKWSVTAVLIFLSGCGSFQPFATPFVPRPALPRSDVFPGVVAQDAINQLQALEFECEFAPDSDIPGGWGCFRGDQATGNWMQVSINSDETGPIRGAFADLFVEGQSKQALDEISATTFQEVMLSVFVPDEVHPEGPDLVDMVSANWPTDLGSGWLLGFDRSSRDRRLNIVFNEAGIEAGN
jgi:hypothetical protein